MRSSQKFGSRRRGRTVMHEAPDYLLHRFRIVVWTISFPSYRKFLYSLYTFTSIVAWLSSSLAYHFWISFRRIRELFQSMFPLKAAIKNSRVDYHSPHPRININFLLVAPSRFAQELSGLEPDLLLLQSQGNKVTRCVSTSFCLHLDAWVEIEELSSMFLYFLQLTHL